MTLVFFGPRWDAPAIEGAEQRGTPVGQVCHRCEELVAIGDRGFLDAVVTLVKDVPTASVAPIHAECRLDEMCSHQVGLCHHTGYEFTRARARAVWSRFFNRDGRSMRAPSATPSTTGQFVVFEGGEGSGKTTQVRLLAAALRAGVLVTRQPGGTAAGQVIRQLLLDSAPGSIDDRAEALLYAADRAQHVDEVIRPALLKGVTVICDRYVDSSIAYQAGGREMPSDWIRNLSGWATRGLVPDLTVLLDIDPAVGLARAARRGAADRLEAAGLDFHRRVRVAYLDLAAAAPDRYLVLPATLPVNALADTIAARVRALIATPTGVTV